MVELYWCRRPFEYCGEDYDRGQIIRMANAKNDEKLIRLGYVEKAPPKMQPFECGHCAKKFIEMAMRDAHGRKRHDRADEIEIANGGPTGSAGEPSALIDVSGDREERMLAEVAPLYLDKTKATRAA